MTKKEIKELLKSAKRIGKISLNIINTERNDRKKGSSWDLATEINSEAKRIYSKLEKGFYPLINEGLDEEEMWDKYLLWCREQENSSHEG